MCAKQLKEHVKQVKKLVQVHTVVLCVGPFLCRFSIDRDGVFTCLLHKTDWPNGAWTKNIPPRVSHFSALVHTLFIMDHFLIYRSWW